MKSHDSSHQITERSSKIVLGLLCIALYGCTTDKAQQVINKTIEKHGGTAYESFKVSFDFRDRHYTATRNEGMFTYTREFADSTGVTKDVLNNEGFVRYHNGAPAEITDERRKAFRNSVNAVIYFALLPFGLNDDAVKKQWLRETTIKGEPYDLVRITFDQPGGGEDHQDVFLYWVHREKNTTDYIAYSYEIDGGGLRLREATNARVIGGIRFQDYINYKPADERIPLETIEGLYTAGKLEKLSEIKLENVQVVEPEK